jgi:hypothetical protein
MQSSIVTAIEPFNHSTTTSNLLRSNNLHSVIENKRRHFSRSGSSSDSEDNISSCDVNRPSQHQQPHSSKSLHNAETSPCTEQYRGRSFSNIDRVPGETSSSTQQQAMSFSQSNSVKRRSLSRTNSNIFHSRLTFIGIHDESETDLSMTNSLANLTDRVRSLSTENRLANQSQMSIASRISIRYSTPRESTVFTKTDAPMIVRLLQQTVHHDSAEAIRTIIEAQRTQSSFVQQEQVQKAIIVEEELSQGAATMCHTMNNAANKTEIISNGIQPVTDDQHVSNSKLSSMSTSSRSIRSTLRCSSKKHKKHQLPVEDLSLTDKKATNLLVKHRACCVML